LLVGGGNNSLTLARVQYACQLSSASGRTLSAMLQIPKAISSLPDRKNTSVSLLSVNASSVASLMACENQQ